MNRVLMLVAVLALLGIGAAGYTTAQDTTGTPGADAEFCASPEASPGASPEASPESSPEIITDASPAVVATSVVEEIEGGLDSIVCGTPVASPSA